MQLHFIWNVKKNMSLKTNALLKRNHPVKMMDGFKNKADDSDERPQKNLLMSCQRRTSLKTLSVFFKG